MSEKGLCTSQGTNGWALAAGVASLLSHNISPCTGANAFYLHKALHAGRSLRWRGRAGAVGTLRHTSTGTKPTASDRGRGRLPPQTPC